MTRRIAGSDDAGSSMLFVLILVNVIRTHGFNGATGQHCFSNGSENLTLTGFTSTQSASVTCAADPAKVLIQCPSLSQCNRPGSAILTLGRVAGEPGIKLQQPTG